MKSNIRLSVFITIALFLVSGLLFSSFNYSPAPVASASGGCPSYNVIVDGYTYSVTLTGADGSCPTTYSNSPVPHLLLSTSTAANPYTVNVACNPVESGCTPNNILILGWGNEAICGSGGGLTGIACVTGGPWSGQLDATVQANKACNTAPLKINGPGGQADLILEAGVGGDCTSSTPTCTVCSLNPTSSVTATFDSTTIPSGDYLWFSAVLQLTGSLPSSSSTLAVSFYNQQITITPTSGSPITLTPPNSVVTFEPGAAGSSTTSYSTSGGWATTVSWTDESTGNQFLSGLAYLVPSGVNLANAKVTWTGKFSAFITNANCQTSGTSTLNVDLNWKFGAAVYSQFTTNYGSLGVKPTDVKTSTYNNNDNAGTPENYKSYVVSGGTGSGGDNFTGEYNGTSCVCIISTTNQNGKTVYCYVGDAVSNISYITSKPSIFGPTLGLVAGAIVVGGVFASLKRRKLHSA